MMKKFNDILAQYCKEVLNQINKKCYYYVFESACKCAIPQYPNDTCKKKYKTIFLCLLV